MQPSSDRTVVGAVLIDLIKFFKNYEKTRELPPLSQVTRALVDGRVVGTRPYPLACFHELLVLLNVLVLKNSETRTLEMGAAGGAALRGVYKTYGVDGQARSSVLAMRHSWRAHYNFGSITVEIPEDNVLLFQIHDYPDIPMTHALMTAGWGVGAARAAGVQTARCVVVDRPWLGGESFRYRIEL